MMTEPPDFLEVPWESLGESEMDFNHGWEVHHAAGPNEMEIQMVRPARCGMEYEGNPDGSAAHLVV
jgi:hypothetical protein